MRWAPPWLTRRVAKLLLLGEYRQDQTHSVQSVQSVVSGFNKSCNWCRILFFSRSFSPKERSRGASTTSAVGMVGETAVHEVNGTANGSAKKIKIGAADKGKFLDVYKQLKSELLADSGTFHYTPESREWVDKMLDYNVPGGKLNRGLSVVDSLALLKQGELTDQEFFLSSTLGWCIEWLQAYFLVEDDIMDQSVTRRGQPCWYKVPKVGIIAVNDGIVLRNHLPQILKRHFKSSPYYVELLDLFNEVEYQTSLGQMLDLITTPEGEVDISKYVISTNYEDVIPRFSSYTKIVQYKTAYYSFYLPVACALLMVGEKDQKVFESAEDILVQMGTYFQVQVVRKVFSQLKAKYEPGQCVLFDCEGCSLNDFCKYKLTDDFLDCYGDPEFIGKIGTDIEDTKCSWLIVKALEQANAEQKRRLEEIYGKKDPAKVAEVKKIYKELKIQTAFEEYEQEFYENLTSKINEQASLSLQAVYKAFLGKIYKRQK